MPTLIDKGGMEYKAALPSFTHSLGERVGGKTAVLTDRLMERYN